MVETRGQRRTNLSQERSQQRRRDLVEAAEDLWGEGEFDAVKVEDLCARAGLSKGLFYFYFPTKDDLLVELLRRDVDDVCAAVERVVEAGGSSAAALEAGIAALVRRARRRPRELLARGVASAWLAPADRTVGADDAHASLPDVLTDLFARGRERGEIRADLPASEIAAHTTAALGTALLEWATSSSRQPSLARRLDTRIDLVLRGAAT